MKQEMEAQLETLKFYSPLVIMRKPLDEYGGYEPIDSNFGLLCEASHKDRQSEVCGCEH